MSADASGVLIYIVEDDPAIQELEFTALSRQGYEVKAFSTGADFFKALEKERPNLCVLDLMLPDTTGENILRAIRVNGDYDGIQVVIVSAKNLLSDRVDNLEMGADDYIEKPFDIIEFIARINARLRRSSARTRVSSDGICVDEKTRSVRFKGENLKLTNAEFVLLAMLVKGQGAIVSRKDMVEKLWGSNGDVTTRTIDTHINSIRKKLGDVDGNLIQTVYGVGYKLPGENS